MTQFPQMHRRRILLTGVGLACAAMTPAWAAGAVLPTPQSLADELAKALEKGQPLLVMVSLDGCPFCKVARDSYLDPLRRQEGVPVFQIDMRSTAPVADFNRMAVTHETLIQTWRVKVAPTVLFFGPNGREVAERLEGGSTSDFYGAYLDQRMERARAMLKA